MTSGIETKGWWETLVDQLNVEELHQMYASLDELEQSLQNEICLKTSVDPGASSSSMVPLSNLDQTTNLFPTYNPNEAGPSNNSFSQGPGGFMPN